MTEKKNLPPYFPHKPPIYDIAKSYAENAADGPFFTDEIPPRIFPPEEEWIDFLDYKVASPIGVPAGPLLNSNWISLAGKLGFDIPVYKTIRSDAHPGHALPNMVFVSPQKNNIAINTNLTPQTLEELTLTNSFGMPSKTPAFLEEDIPKANASLHKGQVLVVSVVGSICNQRTFLEDFVQAALLAKNSGAKIIEANFSCPNVGKEHGSLYTDPTAVANLGKALVKAVAPLPLIIKVGTFPNNQTLRKVLISAASAGIRAISGLNSVSMKVTPPLDENRKTSGICGAAIHTQAIDFVKSAAQIIDEEKLDLTLIGVGGIVQPEHFNNFLHNGAHIAMCATGMMWDPYLGIRYHNKERKHVSICT